MSITHAKLCNTLKMKPVKATILEHYDGDDLYMVVIWQHDHWTAEVFVNGSSVTRVHADDKVTVANRAEAAVMMEIDDRRGKATFMRNQ